MFFRKTNVENLRIEALSKISPLEKLNALEKSKFTSNFVRDA